MSLRKSAHTEITWCEGIFFCIGMPSVTAHRHMQTLPRDLHTLTKQWAALTGGVLYIHMAPSPRKLGSPASPLAALGLAGLGRAAASALGGHRRLASSGRSPGTHAAHFCSTTGRACHIYNSRIACLHLVHLECCLSQATASVSGWHRLLAARPQSWRACCPNVPQQSIQHS